MGNGVGTRKGMIDRSQIGQTGNLTYHGVGTLVTMNWTRILWVKTVLSNVIAPGHLATFLLGLGWG